MKVRLPDGSVIPDFPDHPTVDDVSLLQAHAQKMLPMALTRNPKAGPNAGAQIGNRNTWKTSVPYDVSPEAANAQKASGHLSTGGKVAEAARVLGSGVYHGINTLPDLVNQGINFALRKGAQLTDATGITQNAEDREAQIQEALAKRDAEKTAWLEPKTGLGQRASDIIGSGLGALTVPIPGGKASLLALSAMGGQTAAELAGAMSNAQGIHGGPDQDRDQLFKTLVGMGIGAAGPIGVNTARDFFGSELAKQRIGRLLSNGGLMAEDLSTARGNMRAADNQGISLTLNQGLDRPSPLQAAQIKAASKANSPVGKVLRDQPAQSQSTFNLQAFQNPLVSDGGNLSPIEAANQSRYGANGYFDMLKARGRDAAAAAMSEADQSPVSSALVNRVFDALQPMVDEPNVPASNRVGSAVQGALINPKWREWDKKFGGISPTIPNPEYQKLALQDPKLAQIAVNSGAMSAEIPNPKAAGMGTEPDKFLTDQLQLRNAINGALDRYRGQNQLLTPATAQAYQGAAGRAEGILRDMLYPEMPQVSEGKAAMSNFLNMTKDRDIQQPIETLSGKSVGPATRSILDFMDSSKLSPQEYDNLATKLDMGQRFGISNHEQRVLNGTAQNQRQYGQNPTFIPDVAATYLKRASDAAAGTATSHPSDSFGKDLTARLGNFIYQDPQAKLTEAILRNSGKIQGMPGYDINQATNNFSDLMQAITRTTDRSGASGNVTNTALDEASSPRIAQALRKALSFMPQGFLKRLGMNESINSANSRIEDWLNSELLNSSPNGGTLEQYLTGTPESASKMALIDALTNQSQSQNKGRTTDNSGQ